MHQVSGYSQVSLSNAQGVEAIGFTGNKTETNLTDLVVIFKITTKNKLLHCIEEVVVFLAYFRREMHGHPSFHKRSYLVQ